jgi:hypothetical protein
LIGGGGGKEVGKPGRGIWVGRMADPVRLKVIGERLMRKTLKGKINIL